ncbi:hypothetical protein CA54_47100 [Symmachiella macrocystis]|uniref:Uncharacterized protein n=1 Tax=Symmachiella macrocystis TaxID=2527985 RepID=A0A5C6BBU7_9PLAN|nr:hypothetical protein [Symmachiella macrocystis]TWU09468.1 hypothetical protein CA54_47100 [Symmachiella macrocystis]
MRVHVESQLDCDPQTAWEHAKSSAMLVAVSKPMVDLRPLRGEEFPNTWQQGMTIRCRSFLFGFLPQGTRELYFERVDDTAREIQTREHDALVRRWDHLIRIQFVSVEANQNSTCIYSDTVDISAGWLTLGVWLFASCFYRHRHRRWRRMAANFSNSENS